MFAVYASENTFFFFIFFSISTFHLVLLALAYEISNFILDARYNVSLTKANKNSTSDNKWRSDLIQITVGYKFEL